jgi:hypothetical protein
MKTKMTFVLGTLFLLAGCGLIKDAAEVTIDAQLSSLMQLTVTGEKSAELTSGINALPFSKEQVLYLKDNPELEPYLKKIRKIDIQGVMVDIYGLNEGQFISTLSLDVKGVGTIATITNITAMNIAYAPVINQAKLEEAGKKLKNDLKVTLVVHGEASGPLSFNINMMFPVKVVAGALD